MVTFQQKPENRGITRDGMGKQKFSHSKKSSNTDELFEELGLDEKLETRNEKLGDENRNKKRGRPLRLVIVCVVVLVGLIFVIGIWFDFIPWKKGSASMVMEISGSKKSGWEAVFLTNGQVYFGQVGKEEDGFLVMTNIYYLKSKSKSTNESKFTNSTNATNNVGDGSTRLVKFGTEAHRPVDELRINILQVLMIEELSGESEVVRAIEEYEE